MRFKEIGPDVLARFKYDPQNPTGLAGQNPGAGNRPYHQVQCGVGVVFSSHRIVWALHHGDPGNRTVDHINGNKKDNRIENLRLADMSEQQCNIAARSNNKVGVKGLFQDSLGNWVGKVQLRGKSYKKKSRQREVVEAWLENKRQEVHGEFAKH